MTRTDLQTLGKTIVAYGQQYRSTWIPYAVIAMLLAGVWFFWNDTTEQSQVTGEMKHSQESPSPVFYGADTDGQEARLVCAVGTVRRTKPLPDLFMQQQGLPGKGDKTLRESNPARMGKELTTQDKQRQKMTSLPRGCGRIEEEGRTLIVLTDESKSAVCAVGETFNGWRLAYINDGIYGLEQAGIIREISL